MRKIRMGLDLPEHEVMSANVIEQALNNSDDFSIGVASLSDVELALLLTAQLGQLANAVLVEEGIAEAKLALFLLALRTLQGSEYPPFLYRDCTLYGELRNLLEGESDYFVARLNKTIYSFVKEDERWGLTSTLKDDKLFDPSMHFNSIDEMLNHVHQEQYDAL